MRAALLLLVWAACDRGGAPAAGGAAPGSGKVAPRVASPTVTVAISAINLGDDCGVRQAPMPPAAPAAQAASATEPAPGAAMPSMARGDCAHPGCGSPCQQTTMQATFRHLGGAAHKVEIARVELIDANGAVTSTLAARTPTRWQDGRAYQAWDGQVGVGEEVKASFELGAPDYDKVPGGRWGNLANALRARVIVRVDGQTEMAVVTQALSVQPMVVT